ncbi:MAG: DMT family transporter [Alphaproteobacteria bacterium]
MQDYTKGYLILAIVVAFVSMDVVTIRYTEMDGVSVAFWRNFGVFVCLFISTLIIYRNKFITYLSKMTRKEWLMSLLFGSSGAFFSIAVQLTSAVNVLLMYVLSPLLAVIMSYVFLKEKISNMVKFCSVFVIGGTYYAYKDSFDAGLDWGIVFAFIFVLCNSAMSVVARSLKHIPGMIIISIGCIFWSILTFAYQTPALPQTTFASFNMLANILIVAITYGGLFYASKLITAPEVNLMLITETFFGTLMAWIFLNDTPTYESIIGGTVALIAVATNMIYTIKINKN